MNLDNANNKDGGFVKIWASLKDWEWVDDLEMVGFFVRLILDANWKDKEWRGHVIKRGQIAFGRRAFAEKFGLSEKRIRTILKRLEMGQQIELTRANKFSILTIVNYDKFQSKFNEGASKGPAKRPTKGQQGATTTEGEEGEEGKNIPRKGVLKKILTRPDDVDQQVWDDFLDLRKRRKAPLTQTALTRIQNESLRAGITTQQALEICCARGWQGFNADWVKGKIQQTQTQTRFEKQIQDAQDWINKN